MIFFTSFFQLLLKFIQEIKGVFYLDKWLMLDDACTCFSSKILKEVDIFTTDNNESNTSFLVVWYFSDYVPTKCFLKLNGTF